MTLFMLISLNGTRQPRITGHHTFSSLELLYSIKVAVKMTKKVDKTLRGTYGVW